MNEMVVKCTKKKPFNPNLIQRLSNVYPTRIPLNDGGRVGSPAFPGEGMIAAGQSRNARNASRGSLIQSNDGQRCRFLASAYSVALAIESKPCGRWRRSTRRHSPSVRRHRWISIIARSVLSPRRIPRRRRDRHPMRGKIGAGIARLPSRVRGHLYWVNHLPLASRHVPHDRQSPALCGHKNDGTVAWRVCNGIAPW